MHGNVLEWCRDFYAEKLPGGRDPEIVERDSKQIELYRVIRGGTFNCAATDCRSAIRDKSLPSNRGEVAGFRVALTPVQPAK